MGKDTANLFSGKRAKRFANIASVAERKLQQIDSAAALDALRAPPGNRLEALSGDRDGQHSNRINSQWRICFVWRSDGLRNVEIVDYRHTGVGRCPARFRCKPQSLDCGLRRNDDPRRVAHVFDESLTAASLKLKQGSRNCATLHAGQ